MRQRRGQEARDLGEQDVAARQVGQRVEVLGREQFAVDDAALDDQFRRLTGEVAQGLGDGRDVAVDEGDRRRADEELGQGFDIAAGDSAANERVLEDLVVGTQGTELTTKRRDLGDGEAAVLGDDGGAGRGDTRLHFVDGRDLGRLNLAHTAPSPDTARFGPGHPSERVSVETRTPRQADQLALMGFPTGYLRRSLYICGTGFVRHTIILSRLRLVKTS